MSASAGRFVVPGAGTGLLLTMPDEPALGRPGMATGLPIVLNVKCGRLLLFDCVGFVGNGQVGNKDERASE